LNLRQYRIHQSSTEAGNTKEVNVGQRGGRLCEEKGVRRRRKRRKCEKTRKHRTRTKEKGEGRAYKEWEKGA
jgi:hypothetical protein